MNLAIALVDAFNKWVVTASYVGNLIIEGVYIYSLLCRVGIVIKFEMAI